MLNKLTKHAQCSTQEYFVLIYFQCKSIRGWVSGFEAHKTYVDLCFCWILSWGKQAKIKFPLIFKSLLMCSQPFKLCFFSHLISISSVCSPQLQWTTLKWKMILSSNIYKGFVVPECSCERDGWWTHPRAKRQDQREKRGGLWRSATHRGGYDADNTVWER